MYTYYKLSGKNENCAFNSDKVRFIFRAPDFAKMYTNIGAYLRPITLRKSDVSHATFKINLCFEDVLPAISKDQPELKKWKKNWAKCVYNIYSYFTGRNRNLIGALWDDYPDILIKQLGYFLDTPSLKSKVQFVKARMEAISQFVKNPRLDKSLANELLALISEKTRTIEILSDYYGCTPSYEFIQILRKNRPDLKIKAVFCTDFAYNDDDVVCVKPSAKIDYHDNRWINKCFNINFDKIVNDTFKG